MKKILVVGPGGREHALVATLKRSPQNPEVYAAPGNAGIGTEAKLVPIVPDEAGIGRLVTFAEETGIDLTIVGPEAPLVLGIVDAFEARGLRVFGPNLEAAQLEGSKCFTKEFLARHEIPTADFRIFDEAAPALAYLEEVSFPIVVKADGLAAGKGVIVAPDRDAAARAVESILVERQFGEAGARIVIEECLVGSEISIHLLADGSKYQLLETAQDYKPALDGDKGPNTGGMGCYSPYYDLDDPLIDQVRRTIVETTLDGLRADGIRFRGVLYVGLMLTADGPKVLEFNCRFGDPETQAILPRLESDLVEVFERAIDGRLDETPLRWSPHHSVCVVAASGGYPGPYSSGVPIQGLDAPQAPNVKVFHAGTTLLEAAPAENGNEPAARPYGTAGGRVLGVTALGASRDEARRQAYAALEKIHFDGLQCRTDIGLEH